ncbi:MAG: hypothetical protein OEW36_03100 [Hylemonella sp.]|nr:hypothetical protein [Hylemonella sp.]
MRQFTLCLSSLFLSSAALAHEGHGQGAVHGHAADVWGLISLCALAAMAVWAVRKK